MKRLAILLLLLPGCAHKPPYEPDLKCYIQYGRDETYYTCVDRNGWPVGDNGVNLMRRPASEPH